jgi:hypothetical protein
MGLNVEGSELLPPAVATVMDRMVKKIRTMLYVSLNEDGTLKHPIPTGGIIQWGGTTANIPTGWIYCDGRAISRVTYADLFHILGVSSGVGDGVNTFNIPNLTATGTFMILTGV